MINLFYCKLCKVSNAQFDYYLQRIPDLMKRDVLRYMRFSDQKARLMARIMLIDAIGKENATNIHTKLIRGKYNKPFMNGWDEFNISYSKDIVLFCHGKISVGIDVEKNENINLIELIHYLHPAEKQMIEASSNQQHAFYTIWVKKESILKAVGSGLVNDLNKINCSNNIIYYNGNVWYFQSPFIDPEYSVSLCCTEKDCKINVVEFHVKSL